MVCFTRLLVFLALIALSFAAHAQPGRGVQDSLAQLIAQQKGTHRIDLLNRLSGEYRNTNTQLALLYAKDAVRESAAARDELRLAKASIGTGIILRNLGQSDSALHYFLQAYTLAERNGLDSLQADALHKTGVTYLLLRGFDNAVRFGYQGLALWQQLGQEKGMASAHNLIGLAMLNKTAYDSARYHLEYSLALAEATGDKDEIYKPLVNLGDLYLRTQQPEAAIAFIEKSRDLSRETNNLYGMAVAQLKLGEAFAMKMQFQEAVASCEEGLALAEKLGYLTLARNCYQTLSSIHESMGRYAEALHFSQKYMALEDSATKVVVKSQAQMMRAAFEAEHLEQRLEAEKKAADHRRFQTVSASVLVLLALLLVLMVFSRRKLKMAARAKLERHSRELASQHQEMEDQRVLLEQPSRKISESLNYARKVQETLMPESPSYMNIFSGHFIIEKPKDVISGDFCWFTHKGDSIIITVGDCMGHGVPGAFNTVIINSMVAQAINENHFMTPSDLLKEINRRALKTIPTGGEIEFNVGIKIALININLNTRRMIYAGAKTPLYYISDGMVKILPADRGYLGGSQYISHTRMFSNRTVRLKKGDKLFVFTDGYQDQFGGGENRKFMAKNIKKLLDEAVALPLASQKALINQAIEAWRGKNTQTDDITVFGLEI